MSLSKQELFEAIKLARPVFILFICIAHMPGIRGYTSDYDQYNQLSTLFAIYLKDFLARGAVPILTVISGYLALASYKKRSYRHFITEKTKRLFVPFIVWNTLLLIGGWAAYKLIGLNISNAASVASVSSIIHNIFGIYQLPINAPTYFLRDLFMIMLILPVIHFACKTPIRFILSLGFYLFLFWDQPGITLYLPNLVIPVTFRSDMVPFFMVGYFLAVHNQSVPRLSLYSSVSHLILIAIIGVLFSIAMSGLNPSPVQFVQWRALVGTLFVLIAPTILVVLITIQHTLMGRLLAWLSPYSFTLFLSHSISAYMYIMLVRSILGWKVAESSPVYEQILYTLCYLSFVTLGAILTLNIWKQLLNFYQSKLQTNSKSVSA